MSQREVPKNKNPIICLNVVIHGPGLGTLLDQDGKNEKRRKGEAIPKPKKIKMRKDLAGGCVRAKPKADPMNGAVQGVATRVAMTPPIKEDKSPLCRGR